MDELFLYLGKSSLCLSLLLLFFVILLRKETFLKLNRWILLANIVLALTLPLLETPLWFSEINTAKIENAVADTDIPEVINAPVIEKANSVMIKHTWLDWDWTAIAMAIYLVGFLIFLLRFLAQIFSILLLIIFNERERKDDILFVYPGKILAPFSFFSFLFIDKNEYDPDTMAQIIAHEKAHIQQRHSWDILLSELLIIVQWFNPFAWWHRRLVETNLEFMADRKLLNTGTDPKTYQYNLLQIAVPNYPNTLATNYNSSLLKKRIMMMQQKKSSVAHSWKYFLLFPVVLLIWTAFGSPNSGIKSNPFISIITAEANESDIKNVQAAYRKMGVTLVINDIKFDDDKKYLSSLNMTSLSGKHGKCTSSVDGLEPYNYFVYKRTSKRSFACGSSLSSDDFAMMDNPENWDFIFINGQRPTQEKIARLKADTKLWRAATKEKIKDINPESTASTTYTNLTKKKRTEIKSEIASAKTTTIYYLDGMKTDKQLDDFDNKNIRSVKLNKKYVNYYDSDGNLTESLIDTVEVRILSQ